MPIYEYRCAEGHVVERIRTFDRRDEPVSCDRCGHPATPIMSAHHQAPDGIYSYAPNIGNPNDHERRNAIIEERKKRAG